MKSISNLLILALLTVSPILGCSNQQSDSTKSPTVAKGTEDAGGGSITKSSIEQVRTALDRALELASEPVAQKNIFVQFWTDWGRKSKHDFIAIPVSLFPVMAEELKAGKKYSPNDLQAKFTSPFINALKQNKITRLEKGDCLLVGTDHKDASVSKFSVDADICFSIGNLMNTPPSALVQEILSLVIHEVSHLGGNRDEEKAKKWQTEFSNYFGARFGDLTTDTISIRTRKKMAEARSLLEKATGLAKVDPKRPLIYIRVAKASEIVATIPAFLDPLALKLKVRPTQPELIDNYANAVLVFLEKAQSHFAFQPSNLSLRFVIPFGGGLPMIPVDNVVEPERIEWAISELTQSLAQAEQNFLALGNSEIKSVCVLPEGKLDLEKFNTSQMGLEDAGRVQLPARECPRN